MQRFLDPAVLVAYVLVALLCGLALPTGAAAAERPAASPWRLELQTAERLQLAQEQPRKRRTLFDLLFGEEPEPQRAAPPTRKPTVTRRAQQPAALPPAKPAVEKDPDATRLAVFGDSMAVDVARALERFYAEDPHLAVIPQGVGSSGFVRDDFFDWNAAISEQIAADSFDIAVVIIGINDRQPIGGNEPLSEAWTTAYSGRVADFVTQLRNAGKPTVWVGLPPMQGQSYATAISRISEIQKLAVFSAGAEFLDIYERFASEDGKYTAFGPDLNGNRVRMRKEDDIHFSAAGADKLAFYLSQSLKLFYRGGGGVAIEVADPLLGTEAQTMLRPPYQGLGQIRLLEVAGAVISLTNMPRRATALLTAETADVPAAGFDMDLMLMAPVGRADAFGVGVRPDAEAPNPGAR